jgi:hypothetical protein
MAVIPYSCVRPLSQGTKYITSDAEYQHIFLTSIARLVDGSHAGAGATFAGT